MDRAFASGAAGSAPAAPASPSIGFPTAGNPATSTPATKPGPYWYHMITEELRAVIVAAGLTPDHTELDQLATAIASLAVVPDATETLKGKIELATAAEAQALTDAVRAITPLRLKEAMQGTNMSLSANGYQKLPSGLILQWGRVANASRQVDGTALGPISYPIAFPNAVLSVNAQMVGGEAVALGSLDGFLFVKTVGLTSFNLISGFSAATTFDFGAYWFAIGY